MRNKKAILKKILKDLRELSVLQNFVVDNKHKKTKLEVGHG